MKTKNEDIIRKLFESKCSLSPEERAALNNYEYVNDTFHMTMGRNVRRGSGFGEGRKDTEWYYEESKRAEVSFYKEILL